MLTLINTNRMAPPVGPIGLDYVAAHLEQAGLEFEILDLCFVDDPRHSIEEHFRNRRDDLVGLSFRNADDCFWPSADFFVPGLKDIVDIIRVVTDAPVVLGGIGFSIFARPIMEYAGADFGICGDGEVAIVALVEQLRGARKFTDVPGLIWKDNGKVRANPPSWPDTLRLGTTRSFVDNLSYFQKGGQCGLETKRGCNRNCIYCADPLAKGSKLRLREPVEIADEVQSLLLQGIDVFHICDSEFNLSRSHAYAVCEELLRRSLGGKIRWYTYMSPTPFDADLASLMARAGCVGMDFTGDSGCDVMLKSYLQRHNREDIAKAVGLCRENNIAVMVDLLLGGPSETKETLKETIDFIKTVGPDCIGATLGMRLYPGTAAGRELCERFKAGIDAGIRRKYTGPLNLLKPTFYISEALGDKPAEFVRDLIGDDQRFFEPALESDFETSQEESESDGYNYNENLQLENAIKEGARGAYWDILRRLR